MSDISNSNQGPGWNDHTDPGGHTIHSYDGDNSAGVGAGGTGGANGNGNTTSGTSTGNTGVTPALMLIADRKQLYAGTIPAGYTLKNGKVGSYVPFIRHESRGHGDSVDIETTVFRENPAFTTIYNEGVADRASLHDAVTFVNDFYKGLADTYGVKAEQLAKQLASDITGKTLKNADQALAAFSKYRDQVLTKFSASDINAIKQSLASIDQTHVAATLTQFGKALGLANWGINAYDLGQSVVTATETGDWHSCFVKGEAIIGSYEAGTIAAAGLALIAAPETIATAAAISLYSAVAGALIDDSAIEKAGQLIDSAFHN